MGAVRANKRQALEKKPAREKPNWVKLDPQARAIVCAASHIFQRKGYHGTTMEDIADAIGVTKASIYYYFKSKRQIAYYVQDLALGFGFEGIDKARKSGGSPDQQIKIILSHYIECSLGELRNTEILLQDDALFRPYRLKIIRRRDQFERTIRGLVEEGIRQGIFAECNPKMVVFFILGALLSIPRWYSAGGEYSPKEIGEFFSEYFIRGIRKQLSEELTP